MDSSLRVERVTAETGRDAGKVFVLTELPATQAEKWAIRAMLALARAGVDVPDNIADSGMEGLAVIGIRALKQLNYEDAEPLLDEMFECVQIQPDANQPKVVRRLVESDTMEVATRLMLRVRVLKLHMGFSTADGP